MSDSKIEMHGNIAEMTDGNRYVKKTSKVRKGRPSTKARIKTR